jgi:hypothetical protein
VSATCRKCKFDVPSVKCEVCLDWFDAWVSVTCRKGEDVLFVKCEVCLDLVRRLGEHCEH